jgi:hypothetical protein
MLVVPIQKDIILTKDKQKLKVVEYTNYKSGGPAVYARSPNSKDLILVYFFDIDEINGVKVEYSTSSKVFNALGKIDRAQHLPQPDDKVSVKTSEDRTGYLDVHGLKLKSKMLGVNKGLFFKDENGKFHRLSHIADIDVSIGGNSFEKSAFREIYKDYLGV